jgi:hypothetical protein
MTCGDEIVAAKSTAKQAFTARPSKQTKTFALVKAINQTERLIQFFTYLPHRSHA